MQNELTAMIDYLRVSFKTHDIDLILEKVVRLKKAYMQELESGFYGYVGTFKLDNIKVYYSKPGDNRGILVEMSGQGCRQFEVFLQARNKTWFDFFQDCFNHNGNFSRVDIAIDDRKTYFAVPDLLEKVQNGEAISRFKRSDFNGSVSIKDGSNGGTTLYFGSKKSEAYLCFYEKNYEQAEKYDKPVEEMEDWNRYELRMKNERAQKAVSSLMKRRDFLDIGMQVVNNYIRFADKKENEPRSKWETSAFWKEFIGDFGRLSLMMQPEDAFYQKTKRWLNNSCAPSMKMVVEADQTLGTNELSDMVTNAELTKKQEKMLDVWLAEVKDMVHA